MAGSPYGTSGIASGAGGGTNKPKYQNRQYLLLDPLSKVVSPLEFECWLEKFLYWHKSCFVSTDNADQSIAIEVHMKLYSDWVALLKSVVDWDAATYTEIIKAIRDELLVQDPNLTQRATLFTSGIEKGKSFFLT